MDIWTDILICLPIKDTYPLSITCRSIHKYISALPKDNNFWFRYLNYRLIIRSELLNKSPPLDWYAIWKALTGNIHVFSNREAAMIAIDNTNTSPEGRAMHFN